MKQEKLQQQRRGRGRTPSLFLKMLTLVVMMIAGVNGVWAWQGYPTVTLTSNTTATTELANVTLAGINSGDVVEVNGTNYYKIGGDDADKNYIRIEFINGSSHYKFMPGDELTVTMLSTQNGMAGYRLKNINYQNVEISVSAGTPTEITHTLTADDIDADGKLTIYRANGVGHACRYSSFKIKCVRWGTDFIVTSNNDYGYATFQVNSATNSNVAYNTDVTIASAENPTITYTAHLTNSEKLFWRWHIGEGTTDNDYKYHTNPLQISDFSSYTKDANGCINVQAEFVDPVVINAYSDGNGYATFTHGGQQRENGYKTTPWTTVVFTATPNTGYEFEGWYKDGVKVDGAGATYTATSVAESISLTAKFTQVGNTYTVKWDTSKLPSGACDAYFIFNDNSSQQYRETQYNVAEGTKITYFATANSSSDWEINGWRSGDGTGSWLGVYSNQYTVNSLNQDIFIWPEFQGVHYFDAYANEGGTAKVYTDTESKVNVSGNKLMSWTSTGYFEATPNEGYKFTQWNDGNTENPRRVDGSTTGQHYAYTASFTPTATWNNPTFTWNQADGLVTLFDLNPNHNNSPNYTDYSSKTGFGVNMSNLSGNHIEMVISVIDANGNVVDYSADFWSNSDKTLDFSKFTHNGIPLTSDDMSKFYAIKIIGKTSETGSVQLSNIQFLDSRVEHAYTLNAVTPDGTLIKTIKAGTTTDGATEYFPIIVENNGVFYKTSVTNFSIYFGPSASSDGMTKVVMYEKDASIVAFAEGENHKLCGDINVSFSDGKYGYVAAQNVNDRGLSIGKIPYGIYNMSVNIINIKLADNDNPLGRNVALRDGTDICCEIQGKQAGLLDKEFTINKNIQGIINGANATSPKSNQSSYFDYIIISRVNGARIFVNPEDASYALNSKATALSVEAYAYSSSNKSATPIYQWYKNTENSTNGATAIEGATESTYKPSTEANGVTYYYCVVTNSDGSASATSEIASVGICEHEIGTDIIGPADNNDTWWHYFSPFYKLESGEAREFTFTNYGKKKDGDNSNNWYLFAVDKGRHNGDPGFSIWDNSNGVTTANLKELMALRQDRWDETSGSADGMTWKTSDNNDWGDFQNDMEEAQVKVQIARYGTTLYIYAKTVGKTGRIYYYTYKRQLSDITDSDPIYLYFTPRNSHMENFYASRVVPAVQVSSAINPDDASNGSVTIECGDGFTIPSGDYVNEGERMIFTATNGSKKMYKWTADGTAGVANGTTYSIASILKNTTVTAHYTDGSLSFEESVVNVELDDAGVGIIDLQIANNTTDGEVVYSIVYPNDNAATKGDVTYQNGSGKVTVFSAGDIIVHAQCGSLTAEYTVHATGFAFKNTSVTYDYNSSKSYTQTVYDPDNKYSKVTYRVAQSYKGSTLIDEKYGALASCELTVDENTGTVTGFPDASQNQGGTVVIEASYKDADDNKHVTIYTITVPYSKHVWNFYKEGFTISGDNGNKYLDKYPLVYGHMVNGINPHAASQVAMSDNLDGVSYDASKAGLADQLKRRKKWMDAQASATENKAEYYWDYTFKTLESVGGMYTYANEPLFSYKKAVNGNNACVIENTAGLVFSCAAGKFGINDSNEQNDYTDSNNKTTKAQSLRETNRAILIYNGSSFTIPGVKAGQYVKIHWYRHADDAGDMFKVTKAKDLDNKVINPNDRLRFTGSHYEGNPGYYRGWTILKVAEDGDMVITAAADKSWTEIYEIELTDTYSTELEVICTDVVEDTGHPNDGWGGPMCTGTSGTNLKNNVINVVRNTRNDDSYEEEDLFTSDYIEKEKKNLSRDIAQLPSNPIGDNPLIYIASYPGITYGWNGWNLDVEASPVEEDKDKLKIGLQKQLYTRIGNNIVYGVYALTNFEGTGTAHVIVRTKSGSVDGGDQYTLDMQEAYFPVGEYHSQSYPYTWDFTNYNMEGDKLSSSDYTTTYMSQSNSNSYGGWTNENKMKTYVEVPATTPIDAAATNQTTYKKYIFANGSQLTYNKGNQGATFIREADGLRVNLNANALNDQVVTMDGGKVVISGNITIPEVSKGMYIFVKGTAPTSASNTVASDIEFAANKDGDVTCYKTDWDEEDKKRDVILTFGSNSTIYKIGVTDQVKTIAYHGWSTESRAIGIDYNETPSFSAATEIYKLKSTNGWNSNYEIKTNGQIEKVGADTYIPAGTGLIVKNTECEWQPADKSVGTNIKVPLFAPAVNIPEVNTSDLSDNKLLPTTTAEKESQEISSTKVYEGGQYFVLSNYYYRVYRENDKIDNVQMYVTPGLYRYGGSTRTVSNMAYLYFEQAASSSKVNANIAVVDFEEGDGESIATEITDVVFEQNDDNAPYYNINGQVLNGKPVARGIYIKNGKKYFVK